MVVYIILGEGFEEIEAVAPCDILRRGGIEVKFVGVDGLAVRGGHGIIVNADAGLNEIDLDSANMLVIPGGMGGVNSILSSQRAMDIIKAAFDKKVALGAICAGPTVLAKLGITDGKKAVCYPGTEGEMGSAETQMDANVVVEDNLITGRAPGAAIDFGLALLEYLKGKETAEEVRSDLCYERR